MEIKFDEKLNKKLYKYCLIVAKQYGHGGDLAVQIAKEARQDSLIRLFKQKENKKEYTITDNFLFIVCKRAVYTHLTKQDAKIRQIYKDSNTILIDTATVYGGDMQIEIEDEQSNPDYVDDKEEKEYRLDKLHKRVQTILASSSLSEFEKKVFSLYFLDNLTQKEICKKTKTKLNKISKTIKKIRIEMQYNFEFDGKQITTIRF